MTNFKFHYQQDASTPQMIINNDWGYSDSEVKTITHEQTAQSTLTEMQFPNGFAIKIDASARVINFYTTHPLKKNEDGTFSPDMSE